MFYSRPQLPQLGLDLAEVDGGLGRPSQYRGRTADGRAVRLGYDRGKLSVAFEDGPAGLGEELISVQIGPRFNGDMLLEQICDLTGITLRGEKPRLSEEIRREAAERNWVLDWSGKTTYWVGDLNVTEAGGRSLARELAAAFPDLHILEVYWDYSGEEGKRRYLPRRTVSQCERAALFGFGADEAKLARLLTREHVTLAELDEVFAYSLDFQFEWEVPALAAPAERLAARHGRALELPEMRVGASLETQFTTDDPRGRAYMDRLLGVMHTCFSPWIEEVDLATGETLSVSRGPWCSTDLRDWCAAAPGRFLGFSQDAAGRDIAHRACSAPV